MNVGTSAAVEHLPHDIARLTAQEALRHRPSGLHRLLTLDPGSLPRRTAEMEGEGRPERVVEVDLVTRH
jgi:hypothetical protein